MIPVLKKVTCCNIEMGKCDTGGETNEMRRLGIEGDDEQLRHHN